MTKVEGADGEGKNVIEKAILRDTGKRLREMKNKFGKHYTKYCHRDPEYARTHPPRNCEDIDKWNAIVEMIESIAYQVSLFGVYFLLLKILTKFFYFLLCW